VPPRCNHGRSDAVPHHGRHGHRHLRAELERDPVRHPDRFAVRGRRPRASSSAALSGALVSTATYRAVKYDQGDGTASFHVPGSRWAGLPTPTSFPPYTNTTDVHHMIRDFMAVHAATLL
jgi:hypothetical protein